MTCDAATLWPPSLRQGPGTFRVSRIPGRDKMSKAATNRIVAFIGLNTAFLILLAVPYLTIS